MMNYEQEWDRILNIKTTGRDDTISDFTRYPYEPTDYEVLEQVVNTGLIRRNNTLIDYGCGKGRVSFFLSSQTKCHTIGVEYNPRLYEKALANRDSACRGHLVTLLQQDAADFAVPAYADRAFFFNPFSTAILRTVMMNLLSSCQESPREFLLFFYYPSQAYIDYLLSLPQLSLTDTLVCHRNSPERDTREKLLIFRTRL